ncbi:MAG: helix-turn-helix domain-containing protein [Firmicutes bacterium]|nr:helix-turn-helix domain-containing protein [Bacillota bacterium]
METKDVIADIRKSRGMTQDDMAARLFVTRQAVSRWESGETTPNIETLKAISKEFNVSANTLLNLPDGAVCQSCGMDLTKVEDFGTTEADGAHTDYCRYCMQKGAFTHNRSIDEQVELNLHFLDEYNAAKRLTFTSDEARRELKTHLAGLKRWR